MANRQAGEKRFRLTYKVQQENIRLRTFLADRQISKRTLTAIKYGGGQLSVNGIERDVRYHLHQGDEVEVLFPPEEVSGGLVPEDGELDILYEDEAVLILNKPAGQSTIPSRDHRSGSVANVVAGKFLRERIPATVHVVTRLDRNTSGLLCIAKNRHIHHLLSMQLATDFRREYIAIVEGRLEHSDLLIEEPIGRKEDSIIERTVRPDGQEARTDVSVISLHEAGDSELTAVNIRLRTGRTHQIRVHMQWVGHPLAGDDLYGGSRKLIGRQALHCSTLEFIHPMTEERCKFGSDLPEDMKNIIKEKM